jgi:hypothetical protein
MLMKKLQAVQIGLVIAVTSVIAPTNSFASKQSIRIGQPDCTECAVDLFPADLSGDWSEFCSVIKQPAYVLRFETTPEKYSVSNGHHSCELTDVVDYKKMERRHVVQGEKDCSVGAPSYLVAEYRLSEDNHLEVTSTSGKRRLVDCAKQVQK